MLPCMMNIFQQIQTAHTLKKKELIILISFRCYVDTSEALFTVFMFLIMIFLTFYYTRNLLEV